MATIKEFRGLRPTPEAAPRVAELPYDVIDSPEARIIAGGNPDSYFHISKPEVDLPEAIDHYDRAVYEKGRDNLQEFIRRGTLFEEKEPLLYLYTLIMLGRAQTGLVACVSIDDYIQNRVKKHELTREDKEKDRSNHINILSAQTGLVFLLYREDGSKKNLFQEAMKAAPLYDFTTPDGIGHTIRAITDPALIASFKKSFRDVTLYIADGHHRAASSVNVGLERRKSHPAHRGDEEYNYFLSVIFPHDQLKILPYNRVIRDLNNHTREEFLTRLGEKYQIQKTDRDVPNGKGEICMYFNGDWYSLTPKFPVSDDAIESLDVKILQENVLAPLLNIQDPRKDKRIDFIGGIKGPGELKKLVDSGQYAVAFSLFPTSVEDLIRVSDSGGIMPPKSTWFEPKLRSGFITHLI